MSTFAIFLAIFPHTHHNMKNANLERIAIVEKSAKDKHMQQKSILVDAIS